MHLRIIAILIIFCVPIFSSCAGNGKPDEKPESKTESIEKTNANLPDVSNDEQVKRLIEALEMNQSASALYYDLGQRYLELRRPDLAQQQFTKSLEKEPSNLKFKIALADSFTDQGMMKRAEEIYLQVLEKDKKNILALNSIGVMYYKNGNYESAIERFNEVIQIDPKHIKALFNLGLAYSLTNRLDEAEKIFIKVNELEPSKLDVSRYLADIAFRKREWDKCKKYSLEGLEKNNNIPELIYFLGRVAFEKKDYVEAKKQIEKFLAMNYLGPLESDARAMLLEIKEIESPKNK